MGPLALHSSPEGLRGWSPRSPEHKCTHVPQQVKGPLPPVPQGVKALRLLGQPPLLVPKHHAVPPLKTFPLINEKYTNLFMFVSAFSMTENFITKFTFVFLFIHFRKKIIKCEFNWSSVGKFYWCKCNIWYTVCVCVCVCVIYITNLNDQSCK